MSLDGVYFGHEAKKDGWQRIENILSKLYLKIIAAYRYFISPFFGRACRFYPSCSRYAEEAVVKKGLIRGIFLTTKRLLKCHPFHPGGVDVIE